MTPQQCLSSRLFSCGKWMEGKAVTALWHSWGLCGWDLNWESNDSCYKELTKVSCDLISIFQDSFLKDYIQNVALLNQTLKKAKQKGTMWSYKSSSAFMHSFHYAATYPDLWGLWAGQGWALGKQELGKQELPLVRAFQPWLAFDVKYHWTVGRFGGCWQGPCLSLFPHYPALSHPLQSPNPLCCGENKK